MAEFFKPPNTLKAKVGTGGLTDEILEKAQALLENNTVDFVPLAEMYLTRLLKGINDAEKIGLSSGREAAIAPILYPTIQLKANGGMFHYPLVTRITDRLVNFLETIDSPTDDALEIAEAFHTTLRAIVTGRITGDGGRHGDELLKALDDACERYFEKYPASGSPEDRKPYSDFEPEDAD